MPETLIEKFKDYYFDYRKTSEIDDSFSNAYGALTYYMIAGIERFANQGDLGGIKNSLAQYREIRFSTFDSNDSVKEIFEVEYQESLNRQIH